MSGVATILRAVRFFWQRGDQIIPLLETLPTTLNALGAGMEVAGDGAINTSRVIRGGGGVPVNARQVVLNAAAAIEECKNRIADASDYVEDAADDIGDIKVPTGVTVTASPPPNPLPRVSLVETSVFSSVETAMKDGADKLDDVGTYLQNAANHLNSLAQALDDAGQDMNSFGVALRDSGRDLQDVTQAI